MSRRVHVHRNRERTPQQKVLRKFFPRTIVPLCFLYLPMRLGAGPSYHVPEKLFWELIFLLGTLLLTLLSFGDALGAFMQLNLKTSGVSRGAAGFVRVLTMAGVLLLGGYCIPSNLPAWYAISAEEGQVGLLFDIEKAIMLRTVPEEDVHRVCQGRFVTPWMIDKTGKLSERYDQYVVFQTGEELYPSVIRYHDMVGENNLYSIWYSEALGLITSVTVYSAQYNDPLADLTVGRVPGSSNTWRFQAEGGGDFAYEELVCSVRPADSEEAVHYIIEFGKPLELPLDPGQYTATVLGQLNEQWYSLTKGMEFTVEVPEEPDAPETEDKKPEKQKEEQKKKSPYLLCLDTRPEHPNCKYFKIVRLDETAPEIPFCLRFYDGDNGDSLLYEKQVALDEEFTFSVRLAGYYKVEPFGMIDGEWQPVGEVLPFECGNSPDLIINGEAANE